MSEPMTKSATDTGVLKDEQALAWLKDRPDGLLKASHAELARQWGWGARKVSGRLKLWEQAGHLTQAREGNKFLITLAPTSSALPAVVDGGGVVAPRPAAETLPSLLPDPPQAPSDPPLVPAEEARPAAPEIERAPEIGRPRAHLFFFLFRLRPVAPRELPAAPPRTGIIRMVTACILAALAAAIGWYGLRINAWYGQTLGKTAEAGALLAGLSVTADALALVLPAAARALWQDRKRPEAAIAWGLWTLTIGIALLATVGFAALNIADTTAARSRAAEDGTRLVAQIERLRDERAGIAEARPVAAIEAEIQRAQPGADAVWHLTAGCTDVTKPQSGRACAEVLRLRQAAAVARRRDAIEAEMREVEAELRRLPAVTSADPQAETAARLVNWLTRDAAAITSVDIQLARVSGMALLPQIAGLVFMLATALWQPRRRGLAA
jgi:hypothetical protein